MPNTTTATFPIHTLDEIRTLMGARDEHLKQVRDSIGIDIVLRGDEIRLQGEDGKVKRGIDVLHQLRDIIEQTGQLKGNQVYHVLASRELPSELTTDQLSLDAEVSFTESDELKKDALQSESGESLSDLNASRTHDASSPQNDTAFESSLKTPKLQDSINIFEKDQKILARSPGQKLYIRAMQSKDLVLCAGPAGCGKTYLAVAMAINALRRELVRKIVLVRPAVEAGEKLGFLPGDLIAKVNPYLRPLLDALNEMLDFDQVQRYMERDIIEIVPLAFMRGRTLNNTFIILDEGQNTTVTQMKMFLTRMGADSRIVVTGDITQTDLPNDSQSGLTDAIHRLVKINGVEYVQLSGEDIVRHRLVREVVKAYDEHPAANLTEPSIDK